MLSQGRPCRQEASQASGCFACWFTNQSYQSPSEVPSAPLGRGSPSRYRIYPQPWAAGRLRGEKEVRGPRGPTQHTSDPSIHTSYIRYVRANTHSTLGGWHRQGDELTAAGVHIQHIRRTAARERQPPNCIPASSSTEVRGTGLD